IRSGGPGDRRVRKICDFSSFRTSWRRQRSGGEGRAGSPRPAGGNDGDRSSSPVCRRRVREKKSLRYLQYEGRERSFRGSPRRRKSGILQRISPEGRLAGGTGRV